MTTEEAETTGDERPWYRTAASRIRRVATGVVSHVRRPGAADLEMRSTGDCPFEFEVRDGAGTVYAPWTDGRHLAMRATHDGRTEFYILVPSPSGHRPTVRLEHVGADHFCPAVPVPLHGDAGHTPDRPDDHRQGGADRSLVRPVVAMRATPGPSDEAA